MSLRFPDPVPSPAVFGLHLPPFASRYLPSDLVTSRSPVAARLPRTPTPPAQATPATVPVVGNHGETFQLAQLAWNLRSK
ncbi:hypothetical protein C2845_PMPSC055895 [Panicum miliaceum]|uniref:Uncharacterized protein n=1 Tax=Panicum miliaceum TaxID=4540 RepID=A0A3L6P999_PANMI|nr:hypothetical protein C2845_PMPSC055895 [Panicum miliaceum]